MRIDPLLIQYADFLWFPIALAIMERGKKLLTCGFIGACIILLRLQVELLQHIGYPRGFLGVMENSVLHRGLITYGVFIAFFLLIAWLSKREMKHVHMAASIVILIASFCVSSIIMVL